MDASNRKCTVYGEGSMLSDQLSPAALALSPSLLREMVRDLIASWNDLNSDSHLAAH